MHTTHGLRVATLAGLLAAGGAMSAGATSISGAGDLGRFTGDVAYSATSDTQATLTIKLTNTSLTANGGYITSFVLNNPNDSIKSISGFTDASRGFELLSLKDDGINSGSNGQFDFGAATGGKFTGGGKPQGGIAAGASDTFTFHLTGTGLSKLNADSFLTAVSSGKGAGDGYAALDVRFKGFADGGSDKVTFTGTIPHVPLPGPGTPGGGTPGTPGGGTPGTGTPGTGTPGTGTPGGGTTPGDATAVPEPGSIALLGAGLAALGVAWRRRARA